MEQVIDMTGIDEYRPLKDEIEELQNNEFSLLKKKYSADSIITYNEYVKDENIINFNKLLQILLQKIREYISHFQNPQRNLYVQNLLTRYRKLANEYTQWYDEIRERYVNANKRAWLITHPDQLENYLNHADNISKNGVLLENVNPENNAIILEDIKPETQIYRQTMLQNENMKNFSINRLADIEEQHNKIIKIANDVAELNRLFMDMSILVMTQDETIGNIALTIATVNENVNQGTIKIDEAKSLQSSSRKRVCCILIVVIVIMVIITSIIVPSVISRL